MGHPPGHNFQNLYTYDAASNRTGLTAPDNSTNTYQYDTLNRLTTLGTGDLPAAVAVGDFNNDGKLDLATANEFSGDPSGIGKVSVLLGKSNKTFVARREFGAGVGPLGVALGDFDSDGDIDVAVVNGCGSGAALNCGANGYPRGTVSILLGKGNGTFRHQVDYPAAWLPIAVVAADFNGDGNLDLAVVNWCGHDPTCGIPGGPPVKGTGVLSILLGKGDGTFQPRVDYQTGWHPASLAVADFNRDGNLDLVVVNQCGENTKCENEGLPGTVSILLGNGDGTFRPRMDFATGKGPESVVVGDFNRDSKVDLAVTNNGDNTVSILLGKGDGTFQTHMDYGTGSQPWGIAAGDFNGDGQLDLAVADIYPDLTVSLLLGNGDGTFRARVDYPTGSQPEGVVAADFNDDGKVDLAVTASQSDAVSVLLGNGDGTFRTYVDYSAGSGPYSLAVADVNRDGKPDLVIAAPGDNAASVLLNTGAK